MNRFLLLCFVLCLTLTSISLSSIEAKRCRSSKYGMKETNKSQVSNNKQQIGQTNSKNEYAMKKEDEEQIKNDSEEQEQEQEKKQEQEQEQEKKQEKEQTNKDDKQKVDNKQEEEEKQDSEDKEDKKEKENQEVNNKDSEEENQDKNEKKELQEGTYLIVNKRSGHGMDKHLSFGGIWPFRRISLNNNRQYIHWKVKKDQDGTFTLQNAYYDHKYNYVIRISSWTSLVRLKLSGPTRLIAESTGRPDEYFIRIAGTNDYIAVKRYDDIRVVSKSQRTPWKFSNTGDEPRDQDDEKKNEIVDNGEYAIVNKRSGHNKNKHLSFGGIWPFRRLSLNNNRQYIHWKVKKDQDGTFTLQNAYYDHKYNYVIRISSWTSLVRLKPSGPTRLIAESTGRPNEYFIRIADTNDYIAVKRYDDIRVVSKSQRTPWKFSKINRRRRN